jgi:hypothetical protein
MNPKIIKVTLPVLVAQAVMIAITTLGNSSNSGNNFVNVIMQNLKKSKYPLIRLIHITLVCDNCIRRGKERECQHIIDLGLIPKWQSADRYDDIKNLMGDDQETFMRELKNIEEEKGADAVFHVQHLERMMEKINDITKIQLSFVKEIYVSVDTCAGGENSGFVILSAFYDHFDRKTMVLLGAENCIYSAPGIGDKQQRILIEHCRKILQMEEFSQATIIFIPENNYANEAEHLATALRTSFKRGRIHVIQVNENSKEGIRTSNESKRLMAELTNTYLKSNGIRYYEHFFTLSEKYNKNPLLMKKEILNQMQNYEKKIKWPKTDIDKPPVVVYSGKQGYGFDDMAIALQLNLMGKLFHEDDERNKR